MFISRSIALGLTCFALVAPTAGAQDLRSPDTIDAARQAQMQDLRSPDARDAANPPVTFVAKPAPVETGGSGIDWAPIVLATGGFALAVAFVVLTVAARGRRRVAV